MAFDSLLCKEVDLDQWRQNYRVPLFRDRVNVWVLDRSTVDNPSQEMIAKTLVKAFEYWFGQSFSARAMGGSITVDGLRVLKPEEVMRILPNGFSDGRVPGQEPTRDPAPDQWRQLTEEWNPKTRKWEPLVTWSGMRLRPGPSIRMGVAFNYRGVLPSIPWPTLRGGFSPDCPIDVDWVLRDFAGSGQNAGVELEEVEVERTAADLGHSILENVEGATKRLDLVLFAATMAAAAYLITSVRPAGGWRRG